MALTVIKAPNIYNYSKNACIVELSSDSDASSYEIRVELQVTTFDDTGTVIDNTYFSKYKTLAGQSHIFDISVVLDETMNNLFDAPATYNDVADEGKPIEVANAPLRYRLAAKEYLDGTENSSIDINVGLADGEYYRALCGGISNTFLIDELVSDPMLNWHTWNVLFKIKTDKAQRNVLYFTIDPDIPAFTSIALSCEVYDDNGLVIQFFTDDLSAVSNKMYRTYAGFDVLKIQDKLDVLPYTGPGITYWKVQVVTDNLDAVNDFIEFHLDNTFHKNKSYFQYQNSVNGFDDIRFIGDIETFGDYDRVVSVMSQTAALAPLSGTRKTIAVEEWAGKRINTGNFSEPELESGKIREMALSPRIYEVVGDWLFPMELTDKSKSFIKSGNYLNGVQLEFRNVVTDNVYTPVKKIISLL